MTVREVMNLLQTMEPDRQVVIWDSEEGEYLEDLIIEAVSQYSINEYDEETEELISIEKHMPAVVLSFP